MYLVWTQLEKKEQGRRERKEKKGEEEGEERKGEEDSSVGHDSVESYTREKCADLGGRVLAERFGTLYTFKIKFTI